MSGIWARFFQTFDWHSSPIDWCESNYAVTSHVVEFYNTISNGIFVLLPSILVWLFHPIGRAKAGGRWMKWKVNFVWLLTMVIGVSSAYFHATLTLSGQLLDEFGILWVFGACLAFWFPRHFLPRYFQNDDSRFELLMLVNTILLTILGCFWPFVNSFVLMSFSVPCAVTMYKEMKRFRDTLASRVARRATVLWVVAVIVWLSDRFACGAWQSLSLPGAHWLWHLLVGLSSYQAIVFIIYSDAVKRVGHATPVMRIWPSDSWGALGIAYVQFKSPLITEVNGNSAVDMVHCKSC